MLPFRATGRSGAGEPVAAAMRRMFGRATEVQLGNQNQQRVSGSVTRPGGGGHRDRLSARVYESILEDILDGTYQEGDRLPSESALAASFEVSRPVVREALAQLRDDGLLNARRGSGSYVTGRPSKAVLQFAPLGSIADIQRCFEFRIALEPAAANFAAQRRDADQLRRLEAAVASLDEAVRTGALGAEADFEFHLAVAQASGNSFFETTLVSLESVTKSAIALNRNLSLLNPSERLAIVQKEHEAVLEAIETGNGDDAELAMRRHLEGARRRVFEGKP